MREEAAETGRQQKQQGEDFYGLEDFFKDLEQELSSRRKKRGSRRAEPTIWEELAVRARSRRLSEGCNAIAGS